MADKNIIIAVRESLLAICHPRFFETERGYQGELLAELRNRLPILQIENGRTVVEQEYQKTLQSHGVKRRPDLLLHEPFDQQHHRDRTQGNYAVFELKRRGTPRKAKDDFCSLSQLMTALKYPLAFFINIDSRITQIAHAPNNLPGRLVAFAVKLKDGHVILKEEST